MKKIFLVFGVLIMVGSVFAGGIKNPLASSNSAIVKTNSGVKVFYKSDKATKVKVAIYNEESEIVFYEEVISRFGFIRPYNLTRLPEGDYRVVIKDDAGASENTVSNRRESVKVLASIIDARVQRYNCLVTLFSKGESYVTIKVLDEQLSVLSSESYTVNGQSSKLFNLANVKGPVSVEVSDKNGIIKSAILK